MAKPVINPTHATTLMGALTLLLIWGLSACTQDRTVEQPKKIAFENLFEARSQVQFVGTKQNPLFTTGIPLFKNNRVFFPDYMGHKVLIFDQTGSFITHWGAPGQAPGEFQMPYNVAADDNGNIYVNDRGNQRVQVFSPAGDLLQTVSIPGQNEHLYVSEHGRAIRTLGVRRCGSKACLIQDFDPDTGNRTNSFAVVDQENTFLNSWIATHDAAGRLFLANVIRPEIEVYSNNGKLDQVIELTSPSMNLADVSQLTDNPYEQVAWFKSNQYTSLASLAVVDRHILVQHWLQNAPDLSYLLDIYDLEGNLKFYGVETPGYLAHVDGETYYFVAEDFRDYGTITTSTYVLNETSVLRQLAHR